MAEKDLSSNSDESDEDFVPEGNPTSDEESVSGRSEDESNDEKEPNSKKRRKLSKKKKKKKEKREAPVDDEDKEKHKESTDIDALWADFKQDVSRMEKKALTNESNEEDTKSSHSKNEKLEEGNSNTSKKLPETRRSFPSTVNSGSKLGLSKILNQLGKKEKMSTLAKSKLDWNNFKKSEGIEEEIKMHNRGKDGYLEKQDFLQRTDRRQFEIEKQLRASKRHF